jgi:hypothetical protein
LEEPTRTTVRFEAVLFFAGVFMMAAALGPWEEAGQQSAAGINFWNGNAAFIGGLIAIIASLVTYEYFGVKDVETRRPLVNAGLGFLGALLGLVGSVAFLADISSGASAGWAIYVTIVASLVALFATYKLYVEEIPRIPRGLSVARLSPAEKS